MTEPTTDRLTPRSDTPPADDPADHPIVHLAADLVDAVDAALPTWIRTAVHSRYPEPVPAAIDQQIEAAGETARATIVPRLRELLALDIDEQWTNPLSVIRGAVEYPTDILDRAGVASVDRDDAARRFHPDDRYDLVPSSFADLGQAVADAGLVWGAAKAHVHLSRRKRKETA